MLKRAREDGVEGSTEGTGESRSAAASASVAPQSPVENKAGNAPQSSASGEKKPGSLSFPMTKTHGGGSTAKPAQQEKAKTSPPFPPEATELQLELAEGASAAAGGGGAAKSSSASSSNSSASSSSSRSPAATAAPITCRPFKMSYADSDEGTRVELGPQSCADLRRCGAYGCGTLVCAEHGFGLGFDWRDDLYFPSRVCGQDDCEVIFCERHWKSMRNCEVCESDFSAVVEAVGDPTPEQVPCFCPRHAPVCCNMRFRWDGVELDEYEALRERRAVARDEEDADAGVSMLGSFGLSDTDFLYREAAAKKIKRLRKDNARGIEHCHLMCCAACLDRHTCGTYDN